MPARARDAGCQKAIEMKKLAKNCWRDRRHAAAAA
jgi:hypothetical protein